VGKIWGSCGVEQWAIRKPSTDSFPARQLLVFYGV
jgi:hypothetical protein